MAGLVYGFPVPSATQASLSLNRRELQTVQFRRSRDEADQGDDGGRSSRGGLIALQSVERDEISKTVPAR